MIRVITTFASFFKQQTSYGGFRLNYLVVSLSFIFWFFVASLVELFGNCSTVSLVADIFGCDSTGVSLGEGAAVSLSHRLLASMDTS
jgi:hypothetical protein